MFDILSSDDGSGIAFITSDGKTCESSDMVVRRDDTVELMCEGQRVEVIVTETSSDSIAGKIIKLPFGADLEQEVGSIVKFSRENINVCTHP